MLRGYLRIVLGTRILDTSAALFQKLKTDNYHRSGSNLEGRVIIKLAIDKVIR